MAMFGNDHLVAFDRLVANYGHPDPWMAAMVVLSMTLPWLVPREHPARAR